MAIKMKQCKWMITAVMLIFLFTGCGQAEDSDRLPDRADAASTDISDSEKSASLSNTEKTMTFRAIVLEASDTSVLVTPVEDSVEAGSSDQFRIPNQEGIELQAGDTIEIEYDGTILESYPAQLGEVYQITLIEQAKTDTMWDRIPMVRVNDKLYYDTGTESTAEGRCGNMDGQITSTVDGSEIPMENNQSNFGSGFGYQYGMGDTIEIYMNEKWMVFEYRKDA